jgi:hypothetical protein
MCDHLISKKDTIECNKSVLEYLNNIPDTNIFDEHGATDNHRFLICDICGDFIDLGPI